MIDTLTVRGYWSGPVVLVNMPRGGQKAYLVDQESLDMKVPVLATYNLVTNEVVLTTCGSGEVLNVVESEDYPVDYGKF